MQKTTEDAPLVIAGKSFTNRFMLGTGKFKNKSDLAQCIAASGAQIVTVALRRIDVADVENDFAGVPRPDAHLARKVDDLELVHYSVTSE